MNHVSLPIKATFDGKKSPNIKLGDFSLIIALTITDTTVTTRFLGK